MAMGAICRLWMNFPTGLLSCYPALRKAMAVEGRKPDYIWNRAIA